MNDNPVRALTLEEFATLVGRTGLAVEPEDFDRFIEHGLLVPLTVEGKRGGCYPLQLLGLSRYMRQVTRPVHPWEEPSQEGVTMRVVESLAGEARALTELVRQLRGESEQVASASSVRGVLRQLSEELEEYDPFGPVGAVIDFLRPDVMERLRGPSRLYCELVTCRRGMERLLEQLEGAAAARRAEEALRTTQDMSALPREQVLASRHAASGAAAVPQDDEMMLEVDSEPSFDLEEELVPSEAPAERARLQTPAPSSVHERQTVEMESASVSAAPAPEAAPAASPAPSPELPNPFRRDPSQATSNTQDLQRRLEALRHLDGRRVNESSIAAKAIALSQQQQSEAEEEVVAEEEEAPLKEVASLEELLPLEESSALEEIELLDEVPASSTQHLVEETPLVLDDAEPDTFSDEIHTIVLDQSAFDGDGAEIEVSQTGELELPVLEPSEGHVSEVDEPLSAADLADRIAALNATREAYMREQNWDGLVQLYEEGIELFDGRERQQVYLTLARLYELKLQDNARALENMAHAFELGGELPILRKVLEAMSRLGKDHVQVALTNWIEAQLALGQWGFEVTELLQRTRATLLAEGGDEHRAFLMYASFVADAPMRGTREEGLDFLEELAQRGEHDELYALYDDLADQIEDQTTLYRLYSRAGFFALEREEMDRAVRYLERAIALDPSQEQLFHVLNQIYEDQGSVSGLVVLYERRARATSGAVKEALVERLEALNELELEQSERYLEEYMRRLEEEPQDDVLLERIMRTFLRDDRFAEGYAFLNRHWPLLTAVPSKVRALQTLATIALQNLYSPEEALVHLERALELGGPRKALLEKIIMLHLEQEDWSSVLEYIEQMLAALRDEMDEEEQVRWMLAGCQAATNLADMEQARLFLLQALEVMPGHEQAQRALEEMGG